MIRGFSNSIGSGDWIRTNDLRVMSPTSYLCSTPHYFGLQKYKYFYILKVKISFVFGKRFIFRIFATEITIKSWLFARDL